MSTMREPTMEFFVCDLFKDRATEEEMAQIVAMLESERTYIESKLVEFNPITQDWNEYMNRIWFMIPSETDKRVKEILKP